jgi:hypothetical protein
VETRYESRELGGRRRNTLNGTQARMLQVPGRSDALRDFRGDLRRRRILQPSLRFSSLCVTFVTEVSLYSREAEPQIERIL